MLYPAYVHQEDGTAYGISFPDFPGCHAAADEQSGIPAAAQEAVEAHFYGDEDGIPSPSDVSGWTSHRDYKGGFWMLVDIDLAKVSTRAVRLNISLPENLVHQIDAAAHEQHISRSGFLARAALEELAKRKHAA